MSRSRLIALLVTLLFGGGTAYATPPVAGSPPLTYNSLGAPNGAASLDSTGHLAPAQIPTTVITSSQVGAPSGIAPLDSASHVPAANLPFGTTGSTVADGGALAATTATANAALPASHLGAANGAAELDASSLLLQAELPSIPYAKIPIGTSTGTVADGGAAAAAASAAAAAQTTANGKAASGANSDITSLNALTTPLSIPQGGCGAASVNGCLGNLSALPVVTSTSALEAFGTSGAPAGFMIRKTGNSTAGDMPPTDYVLGPTFSACTDNSGAGDGGSQFPAQSGRCWTVTGLNDIDIRIFNAVPSTTATGLIDPSNYNATAADNAIKYSQTLYGAKPSLIGIGGGGYLYALDGTSIGVNNAKFYRLHDMGLIEIGQGNGASCTAGMINVTGSTTVELERINTDSGFYPISSVTMGVNGTVHVVKVTGQHWFGWCNSIIVQGTPASGSNVISVPGGTAGLGLANGMISQDNTTFGIPDGDAITGVGANTITLTSNAGAPLAGTGFTAPYTLVFGNPTATKTGTTTLSTATASAVLSGSSSSTTLTTNGAVGSTSGVLPGMFVQGNAGIPAMDEVMSVVTDTSITLALPPTATTITNETLNFAFDPHVIQMSNTSGLATFMVSRGNTAVLPDRSWIADIVPNQYIVMSQAATAAGTQALNFYQDPDGLYTGVANANTGGTYDQINFALDNSGDKQVSIAEMRYGYPFFFSGNSNDILVTNALFNNGICAVALDSTAGGVFGTHWEANNDNFVNPEPQACGIGMANGNGGITIPQLNLGGGTLQDFVADNLSADAPKMIITGGQYVSSSNVTESPNSMVQVYNLMVGAAGQNIQIPPFSLLLPGRNSTQAVSTTGPGTWAYQPNDFYMDGANLENVNINPIGTPGTGAFSTLTASSFIPSGLVGVTSTLMVVAAGTNYGTSTILPSQINIITSGTGGVRFPASYGNAYTIDNISGGTVPVYLPGTTVLQQLPNNTLVQYLLNSSSSATLLYSQGPTSTNLAVAAAGTGFGSATILTASYNEITSGTGGIRFASGFTGPASEYNVSGAAINLYLAGGTLLTSVPNGGLVSYLVVSTTSALPNDNATATAYLTPAAAAATYAPLTSIHGQLIGVQLFASTSCSGGCTYTPDAGTNEVIVDDQGAGGGAAGAVTTSTGQSAIGMGGGAGSYGSELFTTGFSGVTVTVPAGGSGGSAGAAGTAGGAATFGALLSCPGGLAGTATTAKSAAALGGVSGKAAACTFGTGTILANVPGATSIGGIVLTAGSIAQSGAGANSPMGSGGSPTSSASASGNNAAGYGAGGSGGSNASASQATAVNGGNGSAAEEEVYEYN